MGVYFGIANFNLSELLIPLIFLISLIEVFEYGQLDRSNLIDLTYLVGGIGSETHSFFWHKNASLPCASGSVFSCAIYL